MICNPVLDCIEDQRCGRGVAAAPVPGRWYDLSVQMAQLAQDPVVYVRVEVPADVSAGLVLTLTVTLADCGDGSGANGGTLIFNPAGPFEFRKPPPFASVATKSIDQVMLMNARQTYLVPGVDRWDFSNDSQQNRERLEGLMLHPWCTDLSGNPAEERDFGVLSSKGKRVASDIREEMRELSVRAPGKTPFGQLGPRTIAQWLTRGGETVFEGWSLQRTKVMASPRQGPLVPFLVSTHLRGLFEVPVALRHAAMYRLLRMSPELHREVLDSMMPGRVNRLRPYSLQPIAVIHYTVRHVGGAGHFTRRMRQRKPGYHAGGDM